MSSASAVKQEILLEAGTNELEVLIFTLGRLTCGVNVAKVREVIGALKPIHVPRTHPAVIGVVNLRGKVIPLVDLQLYFHPGQPSTVGQRHIIVMEFNDLVMGFVIDGVEQIYRLGWDKVEPAPVNAGGELAAVTSVCHLADRLAMMIDFEKIAFDIQGVTMGARNVGPAPAGVDRGKCRLLLAEDSPTTRSFICQTLAHAGYRQVTTYSNGREAWEELQRTVSEPDRPPFDLIISDVEMPQMDGLHLCRRLKEHPQLRAVPVVVFSSLVSEDNLKKMASVGADATLTKPQLVKLVGIIDGLLARSPATA